MKSNNEWLQRIGFFSLFVYAGLMTGSVFIFPGPGYMYADSHNRTEPIAFQSDRAVTHGNELFQELLQTQDEQLDIARMSLRIAQEEYPFINIERYIECIDWYARVLGVRIADKREPESVIQIINDFLYSELGFTYVKTGHLKDIYLNDVLDRREGNCVGMSILYLAIAERLGLPLFGVNVPDHIFVRYDDGETKINIETGHEGICLNDSFYVAHSLEPFEENSVKNGCYLKNLTKKEVISNIFLNLSKTRRKGGHLEEALSDCNKSIILKPNDPAAYCNRGVIYEKMDMIPEAIKSYGKAISLNQKYASAYYNRGSLYGVIGMIDEAINDFNSAIFINPEFTICYFNRAIAYKKTGQLEKAIQDYDKVIENEPKNAQAYCNRGVVFAEKGIFDLAIKDFDTAIDLNPNLSDAYFARAIFFADMDQKKEAIEDFSRCIDLTPDKTFVFYLRGKLYGLIGDSENAIRDLSNAIAIQPDLAGLYIERGIIFYQLNKLEEAISDFDRSLLLFPGNPIAYLYRGKSFENDGQFEKAIEDFEVFLKIVPDSPDADTIEKEVRELKLLPQRVQ
ncbi:MAG: tetratricopeptide repeat protein [Candidatus Scalindua sp.]|nr:tetratricopeptide repeat protein [Candidatus Scalindua sp.]